MKKSKPLKNEKIYPSGFDSDEPIDPNDLEYPDDLDKWTKF